MLRKSAKWEQSADWNSMAKGMARRSGGAVAVSFFLGGFEFCRLNSRGIFVRFTEGVLLNGIPSDEHSLDLRLCAFLFCL